MVKKLLQINRDSFWVLMALSWAVVNGAGEAVAPFKPVAAFS
jgi:hypothetical protein